MSISNETTIYKPKKWSEDKMVKLIRAFRSKPVLWDPRHQTHFNKSAKLSMWNEIAIELNASPTKCKHKIVNLMSGFRREKAKMIRSLTIVGGNWSEDMDYKLRCGWYAFKELGFLIYKDSERIRIQRGQPIDANTDFANLKQALLDCVLQRTKPETISSEEDSQDPIEIIHVTSSSTKTPRPEWANKPASPTSADLEEPDIYGDSLDSSEPGPSHAHPLKAKSMINMSDNYEEINFFANFIASKMKNYSEITKNAVQREICEVIFKADQRYYDNTASEHNFIVYDPLNGVKTKKKQNENEKPHTMLRKIP